MGTNLPLGSTDAASVLPLPVVCVSLGGTKIDVGAITSDGHLLRAPEVFWRADPEFGPTVHDRDVGRFCDALVALVRRFLAQQQREMVDVGVIGLPFPGPHADHRWHSNNLTEPFRRGVALEVELTAALRRTSTGVRVPAVRVVFDAQCDAGGELYHPLGRLRRDPADSATVLNLATGIAAGFVAGGRVLVSDADFQAAVGPIFDAGAGQLGRHLWYHPDAGRWRYHYAPCGGTPKVPPPAVRMTQLLSAPALAARLLTVLAQQEQLASTAEGLDAGICAPDLRALALRVRALSEAGDAEEAAELIRRSDRPFARELLTWADLVLEGGTGDACTAAVEGFSRRIAADLGDALACWAAAPEWAPFARRLVLTGGAGIHLFARTDRLTERSFLKALERALPEGCRVERSCLKDAAEREAYVFLRQPVGL